MRCACIDIGSNTTRLLVAECDDGGLHELHQERVFTRIGRAVTGEGAITPAKIDEVAIVVAGQLATARELGATQVRAVATASVRRASNGAEVGAAVARICGLEVRVLSEHEEARLAFVGAARAVAPGGGELGVVDVGGGSTELAVGLAPDDVRWSASLPVGSGDVSERFLGGDPPGPRELAQARAFIAGELAAVSVPCPPHAVAVGGSATSLSRLSGGLLDAEAFARALGELTGSSATVVAARTGLDPERVGLLPAGLLILQAIAERFGVPLEVGRGGIREAVVLEAATGVG